MNLFWSTRALTSAREDHLTEFFAAALEHSQTFRAAYSEFVLGAHARTEGWNAPVIKTVRTQVCFETTTCCPDMILELEDGKRIACEHKLDAGETMGPEQDPYGQLERYLNLPVDGLLYVRSMWKTPNQHCLEHPKYIRPEWREHFLWRDFYPLLKPGDHILVDWLREGFERLGFTPPHPSIGEMQGPDDEENFRNRSNFAKHWQRTCTFAREQGWKVEPGSIVELYLSANPDAIAAEVFITPLHSGRMLFRITPRGEIFEIMKRLESVELPQLSGFERGERSVKRKVGDVQVLDVTAPLSEVLGEGLQTNEQIEENLLGFVGPLIKALVNVRVI